MGQMIERMIAEQSPVEEEQVEAVADEATRRADTLGDALEPVLGWEQNNLEFWIQVAQLVVLLMILRRVSG